MTVVLPATSSSAHEPVRSRRAERLALMAERRAAERTRELIALQLTRPDLVGAYAPAQFAADAVRWAV
jgi:hypothetical protein